MNLPNDPSVLAPDRKSVRVAISSGVVGTAVEYYDFFVYGTAAALVLNKLFFPNFSPVFGTLAAFATFAVGFVVRPIGAVVLGHVGDRVGRKRALVFSLLLMGIATFAIGFLPTYSTAGILAPILLVFLRLVQGLALGGEWGGATVLASEYASKGNRGLLASFVQTGSPIGLLMSSGAFALVGLGSDHFVSTWGWRIPFWGSSILVAIGLYIRVKIMESPEFRRATAAGEMSPKAPIIEVFQYSWRQVLTAIGLRFVPDIGFYIAATFLVSYAVTSQHYAKGDILACVSVAAAIEICTIPFFGRLSDRFGRKPVYIAGVVFLILLAFPLFALISSGSVLLTGIGVALALAVGHSSTWGLGAAINSELFPTRYRTTGAALGLNVSNIVGGGPAPLIASALVIAAGGASWLVSCYIVLAGVLSLAAILSMPETSRRDLSVDYTGRTTSPAPARPVKEQLG
ncbi:MHS family MFS transporter [Amycolatopsis sp. K13G38]|uniref:MHS family MFS transporter n=1 Tax=Amycolatopsis acididurans TaxID=2724524 RepID=A0ABX1JDM9_9PSEU|nr:MFS transporter [Amycolatopsis acididurans]NKQ57900.1 MHS family MFS transporter [Amycolatopsis acididurans]